MTQTKKTPKRKLNPTSKLSPKQNWGTPADLFNTLHREFHFTVDVCAEAANAKLPHYFNRKMDGLKQAWSGVC
jgi:site-specific DNA-methyltransferase (adenine-specific)